MTFRTIHPQQFFRCPTCDPDAPFRCVVGVAAVVVPTSSEPWDGKVELECMNHGPWTVEVEPLDGDQHG